MRSEISEDPNTKRSMHFRGFAFNTNISCQTDLPAEKPAEARPSHQWLVLEADFSDAPEEVVPTSRYVLVMGTALFSSTRSFRTCSSIGSLTFDF
jgi:hypothetical protein